MSIKSLLKRQAQIIAANTGKHRWPWPESQLVILMYHRILPESDTRYQDEQPGMVVNPETFEMHLSVLKEHFEPVHLSEWLSSRQSGKPLPKRACAITFDDGWQDNYQYAFKCLTKEQVPATIFLVSDFVDTPNTFWPERLARVVRRISSTQNIQIWNKEEFQWLRQLGCNYGFDNRPLTRLHIDDMITKAKSLSDSALYKYINAMENSLPDENDSSYSDILTWVQINEMHNSGLVEFGSHTCNHIRMSDEIDEVLMEQEIARSKLAIESGINAKTGVFCYPNGTITTKADKIVRKYYSAAVTTVPGWNNPKTDQYLLHRIGIHQDISYDKTSFLARLSGFL